ncbi:MAG TPA: LEA type 2 family protein, partial [Trueperaceae bacterium]|nr:LEA type 2 family protein [Trueperaceae bacterium]
MRYRRSFRRGGPRPHALAAIASLAMLVACAPGTAIKSARPLGEIKPPVFEVIPTQTRIDRFDPPGAGAGLAMTVSTMVHNPNAFPVSLESVTYQVVLHGDRVATGTLEPKLGLAAQGEAPLSFQVRADLSGREGLLRAVARAFADTPLPFRVEGTERFTSSSYAFETRKTLLLAGAAFARQTVAPPRLSLDEAGSRVF